MKSRAGVRLWGLRGHALDGHVLAAPDAAQHIAEAAFADHLPKLYLPNRNLQAHSRAH